MLLAPFALLLLASGPGALPTRQDVDWARVERIHQCFGDGGIVHCRRLKRLRCSFVDDGRGLALCSYRESAEAGSWTRKAITLRRDGEDWRWVSGDHPRCSIMVFTDE